MRVLSQDKEGRRRARNPFSLERVASLNLGRAIHASVVENYP
jgi:hypothetical protein